MELRARDLGLVHAIARQVGAERGVEHLREELVATGMLGLAEALGRFDPGRGSSFRTLAAIHVRGRMLDLLRAQRRAPVPAGGLPGWGDTTDPGPSAVLRVALRPAAADHPPRSPESGLTRRELVAALRDALDGLPERERTILVARYLEDRSAEDVGRELGCTSRAVNQVCVRARERLRRRLASFGRSVCGLL